MRKSVIAGALVALMSFPAVTGARSDQSARLTMGQARLFTKDMARAFAERMTPPGVNGRTVVGRCDRKTAALVACRFAAYGTEDVCRGWTNVRDEGVAGEATGWTTRLRCKSA